MSDRCRVCRDAHCSEVEGALALGVTYKKAAAFLRHPSIKAIRLHLAHTAGLRPERLRPLPLNASLAQQRRWLLRELERAHRDAREEKDVELSLRCLQTIGRIINSRAEAPPELGDVVNLDQVRDALARADEARKRKKEARQNPQNGPASAA